MGVSGAGKSSNPNPHPHPNPIPNPNPNPIPHPHPNPNPIEALDVLSELRARHATDGGVCVPRLLVRG